MPSFVMQKFADQVVHLTVVSCFFLAPRVVAAEGRDSEMALLMSGAEFSQRCIGPILGDIELNVDPRYREEAQGLTSALRATLERDYQGLVFERHGRDVRQRAPRRCAEVDGVVAAGAEIHVSLARGRDDIFTTAWLVIRKADGGCRDVVLSSERSSHQCLTAVPFAPRQRQVVSATTSPVLPERRSLMVRRQSGRMLEREEGVTLLAATGVLSLMAFGSRVGSIASDDPVPGRVVGALTWNGAFALVGPAGYYMGRYFGRASKRRVLTLGVVGGFLLVSGIILKPIAWTVLDGLDKSQNVAFLFSDLASIVGLSMVAAAHGERLALRAGANGVSLSGRF